MTDEIACAIDEALRPGGAAVVIEAEYYMVTHGVCVHGTRMDTKRMPGVFDTDAGLRREFLTSIGI